MADNAYVTREIFVAVVFLQPQCNMTCTFCVTEDDFDPIRFEDAVELLDHLVERGVRSVVFGGGEPFQWPGDVLQLAAKARARGLLVQVGTNGIGLPHDFAGLECVDRWVLPLESTDPEVHQAMRHHRGRHHALILERLAELQRVHKSVTLSTVVTAVNRSGLPDLARFLVDYHAGGGNVHGWHLYRFLPLGRGGEVHRAELDISADAYRLACEEVLELELPFRVFRRRDMYRSRTVEFFWSKDGRVVSGSQALHGGASLRTRGAYQIP